MSIRLSLCILIAGLASLVAPCNVAQAKSQFYLIESAANQAATDPENTGRIKIKLAAAATKMQHDTLKAIIQNMHATTASKHDTAKAAINNVRFAENSNAQQQRTTPNNSFSDVAKRGASASTTGADSLSNIAAEAKRPAEYVIEGRDDVTDALFMTIRLRDARIVAADESSRRGLGESILVAGDSSDEIYRIYYQSIVLEYSSSNSEANAVQLDLRLGVADEN